MSSANGPAAKGEAGAKPGNTKDSFVAKAAGAAIASGIAWSIFKSFAPGKGGPQVVNGSRGIRATNGENLRGSTVYNEQTDAVTSSLTYRGSESTHETEDPESTVGRMVNFPPKGGKEEADGASGKFHGNLNHEIIGGETLYTISRKYEVSVETLKTVNGLPGDHIFAGEMLMIPRK